MRLSAQNLMVAMRDMVAPARCMGCFVEGVWLCRRCRQGVRYERLPCGGCGRMRKRGHPGPSGRLCRPCRARMPLEGILTIGSYYQPLLHRGVHWLKFKRVPDVARPLASLLTPRLLVLGPIDQLRAEAVLVPVPLHRQRERERGFNQSAVLAQALAAATGIPLWDQVVRTRRTWTQSRLARELRTDNTAGAFAVYGEFPVARYVLIVDDVTTSGATMAAVATAIRSEVVTSDCRLWGLAIAHG